MDKQKIPEWIEDPLEDLIGNDDDKALELELSDKAKKLYPGPQIEELETELPLLPSYAEYAPYGETSEVNEAAGGEWIPGIKNEYVIYGGFGLLCLLLIKR